MSVRRFVGANSRDVMRQVRETLGDDALIVANRRIEDGVEILAMADEAVDHFEPSPASPPPPAAQVAFSARDADPLQAMSERLLREMQEMRELLSQRQSADDAPASALTDDSFSRLRQQLLSVGFSEELSDEVLAALPAPLAQPDADGALALEWLRGQLMARLPVLKEETGFFDQAGIVALVGPTGVGKTTTTAKLAARFVMRHGTRPVALVTTDSFRIGAHEQLRIYARLLDTPMYALDAEQPIDELVGRLQGKQWVIIDTVGMSQRDQRVIEQIAHLQGGQASVRLVLLLNAASQPETLEEVVLRYRQAARAAGAELDDCIITKQDEAGRLAPVLDIVIRHGLRVLFGSYGQRVPEDMAVADPTALIDQALNSPLGKVREERRSATVSQPHSVSLPRWSRDVLGQGRRLSSVLTRLRDRIIGFSALESIWDIASLPGVLQDKRLDALLASEPCADKGLGMAWSPRRNERGCDWSMPDLGLDADGGWLALTSLQHRQPAGWQSRLLHQGETMGAAVHLLPVFPDPATLAWLEAQHLTWITQVAATQRVYCQGERYAQRQLLKDSPLAHHTDLRFRGQTAQLWHTHTAVEDAAGTPLLAWVGEVRDPENGKRIARRYWLTPARLGADVRSLLVIQLQSDGVSSLTKRAWQQLKDADDGEVSTEVRLLMASGVAAAAGHLDSATDDAAIALRSDLLRLLGTTRKRRDKAMLDALVHAFMARDAIRQLSSVSREGLA
ncbi:flagellar biosynthesis protein FlhF [Vreelandella venusta]|uniref:Flagellar biosynthesis protein FlhF n=1 Tax=Vreelandella venusta TaxID=44935 RepID=A0ABX2BCN5_9GAMM|nr:flagellar biosynthesis protein FlhF [Halomonas venusta]AZM94279.1 flagellar biosynthesis protein FlhF [Halomonas venusta]NPT31747.1 flagellar biosynthesis protein FlhF [Halomonas venusta]UQI40794.1 flagellar biosynthesis protein FlhF [Halomonas venusta]